nr:phosphatase PAP2 family protein [Paenibacillus sp. PL91]
MLLLAALAASIPEQDGNALDRSAEALMASMKSDGATAVFKLFSYLGSTIAIIGITLVASFIIGWARGWIRGAAILAGTALAYVVNVGLKLWLDRQRPAAAWGIEADGASFPSGNAMLATAMFGLLVCAIIQFSGASRMMKAACSVVSVILILMMGLSRVYFHVHYITDIFGGYTAGMAVISLIMIILNTIHKKRGAALS